VPPGYVHTQIKYVSAMDFRQLDQRTSTAAPALTPVGLIAMLYIQELPNGCSRQHYARMWPCCAHRSLTFDSLLYVVHLRHVTVELQGSGAVHQATVVQLGHVHPGLHERSIRGVRGRCAGWFVVLSWPGAARRGGKHANGCLGFQALPPTSLGRLVSLVFGQDAWRRSKTSCIWSV
jgi:hypothetical protein